MKHGCGGHTLDAGADAATVLHWRYVGSVTVPVSDVSQGQGAIEGKAKILKGGGETSGTVELSSKAQREGQGLETHH